MSECPSTTAITSRGTPSRYQPVALIRLKKSKLSDFLRHSRALHLYRAGVPLPLISEWLGHSNIETTLKSVPPARLVVWATPSWVML
ncbi:MAG: tyrosine-type recombinase/integrase [Lachnospiraceae bacterium]|nr:tyrosine-type recombinase/integrase [Lachnospiraceae bacterium]